MIPLLLPEYLMRVVRDRERRHFEDVLAPKAVPWDVNETNFREALCLDGNTYQVESLFETTPIPPHETMLRPEYAAVSPCGKFIFARRILPRGEPLDIVHGRRTGKVWFTTDVTVPILGEVRRGSDTPHTWMSLTPNEMITQRRGVSLAKGDVVVGGLGLGWFLTRVCEKGDVDKVTLVERSQHLVDWLLPIIMKRHPEVAAKTAVVIGDVIRYMRGKDPKQGVTVYLLDIWSEYGDATTDAEFQKLKKTFGPCVWGWGDV